MKIRDLHLQAVGPFTDLSLDLSAGSKGLHIIYGPNEAGKSSALRALHYLFFGFRLDDNFLHPYPLLRVGARICNDRNEELEFLRRKANKNSLRAIDDVTLVSEDELGRFLGHVDENLFTTFFGIDHAMLVRGGQDIVETEGDVGKVLFTGSGVSELHAVLKALDTEAQALFLLSGRATIPRLNDLLRKLETARKTIRDSQLPHRQWDEARTALEHNLKRKEQADRELRESSGERNRLQRVQEALPLMTSRADLLTQAAALAAVPNLPADFRDRRQQTEQNLRVAEAERTRAFSAIESLDGQIDALDIPELFLEQREAIEPINRRLGVYQQAQDDSPGLNAELNRLEDDALETLRKIDRSLELSDATSVHLPDTQRNRINTLGTRYDDLTKQLDQWNAQLSGLKAEIARTRQRLDAMPSDRDPTQLRAALQQAMKLGDIEDQLANIRHEHHSAGEQLGINLEQLSLWSGTSDELERLPLPANESIERFQEDFATIDQELRDLRKDLKGQREKTEELDRKIRRLRLEQDVPTEEDLRRARQRRQQGWNLVREAWDNGEETNDEIRAFLASLSNSHDNLATAFERIIEHADDIADRLRREATRVATLAELQAQRDACDERIAHLNESLAQAENGRQALLDEWKRPWAPVGITPHLPGEMLAWSRQHSEVAQQAQNVRRLNRDLKRLEKRRNEHRDGLKQQIENVSDKPIAPDATMAGLINEAQALLDSISETSDSRKELARDLNRLNAQLDTTRRNVQQAECDYDEWQSKWKEATDGLPLQEGDGPAEANILLEQIVNLSQQLKDAKAIRSRIEQINTTTAQFVQYISDLTTRLSPHLTPLPADQAAAELHARFQKASTAAEKRELLTNQLNEERQNLQAATTRIEGLRTDLATLCTEAGCLSAEELPQTERRCDEKQQTNREIEAVEGQLRRLRAGQSLAEFVAEAQSLDADTLEPRIRQLDEQIGQLNRELKDELGERIGAARKILEQIDSNPKAADAAEKVQDLAARIASDAEEYARLKLAFVMLTKAIERYRNAHQGPILQRTGQLFSDLTVNSFSGVREDFDDDGRPELFGIRTAPEEPLRVKHMSDGTADQLYLAVRLAWLENYLSDHETIPLIVDDVLIRFDDDRAIATLKALAGISARTQVLFFTHHRHLVEFARDVLDDDTLFVHELPRFPSLKQVS